MHSSRTGLLSTTASSSPARFIREPLKPLCANIYGSLNNPYDYWGPGYATRPWVDATDRSINYIFTGSAAILLLLWIGVARAGLLSQRLLPALALTLFATAYALGEFTPLFPTMFDAVPGVDLWRRPADATFLMTIGVALLAGAMLGRYVEGEGNTKLPGTLIALALAGAAIGFALWFSIRLDRVLAAAIEAAIGLALIGALFLLMRRG